MFCSLGSRFLLVLLAFCVADTTRAAPAPFPKTTRQNEPLLVQRVRKIVESCGYQFRGLRPGSKPGEWTVTFAEKDANKNSSTLVTGSVSDIRRAMDIFQVWGKLPEKERTRALVELARGMPAKDRAVIEAYFIEFVKKASK